MKRKIRCALALLLALILMIPQGIYAAGTLTVTTVSGEKGEQVTVEVCLTGDDVCSGNFNVRFDSSNLLLISAEKVNGSWLSSVNDKEKENGLVRVSFAQTTPLTEAALCRLTFEVLENTPADGTAVTIEGARLYNEDAKLEDCSLVFGSVSRDCVWYTLNSADTVEGQGVRAEVHMSGTQQPCGGNFALTYDADVLRASSVLTLEGLENSQMTYNLEEDGVVRIAFAGEEPVKAGVLCAVVFQVVGSAGSTTAVELSDVRSYDENSKAMDTEITNGEIQVVVPTEDDPKLWVVGGALNEDGTATASIVLQGRGKVCGGQCTLLFDNRMTAVIQAESGVEYSQQAGKIHVSWAKETPASGAETLITVTFENAVESALTFDGNVRVYDENSEQIGVVDIRPGAITASERVHLLVEDLVVETEEEKSEVAVTIDLADASYFNEEQINTITPMLALYKDGQLIGLDVSPVSELDNGVAEVSLSAAVDTEITDYAVFVAGDEAMPLCGAIRPE